MVIIILVLSGYLVFDKVLLNNDKVLPNNNITEEKDYSVGSLGTAVKETNRADCGFMNFKIESDGQVSGVGYDNTPVSVGKIGERAIGLKDIIDCGCNIIGLAVLTENENVYVSLTQNYGDVLTTNFVKLNTDKKIVGLDSVNIGKLGPSCFQEKLIAIDSNGNKYLIEKNSNNIELGQDFESYKNYIDAYNEGYEAAISLSE